MSWRLRYFAPIFLLFVKEKQPRTKVGVGLKKRPIHILVVLGVRRGQTNPATQLPKLLKTSGELALYTVFCKSVQGDILQLSAAAYTGQDLCQYAV
jgi:hypothetical protein